MKLPMINKDTKKEYLKQFFNLVHNTTIETVYSWYLNSRIYKITEGYLIEELDGYNFR